ncbi:hypothetical protein [Kibdelosporangium phytohabitans]|uniref:hypothetical protein n=1 Tax=Kibdelosporangium phytohabitans TaxID=860235 RepID=UPI0012FC60AB|nr:hypothetical protein [Kibdelosporangium phytohabitans]MBE1467522.1 hypothetical protein [Kibdelosporangium phytohabitans]
MARRKGACAVVVIHQLSYRVPYLYLLSSQTGAHLDTAGAWDMPLQLGVQQH